jgi:hypothetical protein
MANSRKKENGHIAIAAVIAIVIFAGFMLAAFGGAHAGCGIR